MLPYQLSLPEILKQYQTDAAKGLLLTEVEQRLQQHGQNKLVETKGRSIWMMILEQFKSLLVIILIAAGLFSMYLESYRDMAIMFFIVLVNATIGFFQEWKSDRILSSLKNLVQTKAKVIRNGQVAEILAEDLVPGDIVLLDEGDGVPADLRLIESENLASNDVILTGEGDPQPKSHTIVVDGQAEVTDQNNSLFMGVTIVRGSAKGLVFATGMQTEIGKIASKSTQITSSLSPLQIEINNLSVQITKITLWIAMGLFLIRLLQSGGLQGEGIKDAIIFAIGVGACMVPEGLPAQISVALSLGVGRLAKRNAIVKKLSSVETLGSATVIASDKTGTITKNEMTITHCFFDGELFSITGTGYEPNGQIFDSTGKILTKENLEHRNVFFLDGYLASTGRVHAPDKQHNGWYPLGDPTESAFATLALKTGWNLEELDASYPRVHLLGFDSVRKRMTLIRRHKGKMIAFMKGGIESVLESCTQIIEEGKVRNLHKADITRFQELVKSYASQSYRVLAVAYKDLPAHTKEFTIQNTEKEFIFAGFAVMLDPPHDEVKQALQAAFDAHLRVVMITGDNAVTAEAIANKIGLMRSNGILPQIVNGADLPSLTDADLGKILKDRAVIFSRVSPSDKLRIVEILRNTGEIVAVTGDGVNDTLSLKKAHIGVAMGAKGAEVAKEAADMILLDDNFSTIVLAIQEGRTIYKNLANAVIVSLAANFAELSCLLLGFVGSFWHLPISIQAVQILAVDLVGEILPIMSLTFDPPDKSVMTRPPRNLEDHVLNRRSLGTILFFGFLMGLFAFLAFLGVYHLHPENLVEPRQAWTAAYLTIVVCQFTNILSLRTSQSFFSSYLFSNKTLLISFVISLILLLLVTYSPFVNYYLQTAPLSPSEWLFPVGGAFLLLVIHEIRKLIARQKSAASAVAT